MGRLWIAIALAAGCALAAPPAGKASKIVYTCGNDICSVRPDGSDKRTLTTDGDRRFERGVVREYFGLSLSRDGRRLVFNRATRAYLSDGQGRKRRKLRFVTNRLGAAMHPDGNAIVYASPASGAQPGELCRGTLSPSRIKCRRVGQPFRRGDLGWGPGDSLTSTDHDEQQDICVTNFSVSPPRCTRYLTRAEGDAEFRGVPTLSPDGKLLAVTLTGSPYFYSRGIAVYDVRTARFVRALTPFGPEADRPVWSPDGRWVAYRQFVPPTSENNDSAWSLWRVPATGGTPRRILPREVRLQATWGK